MRVNGLLGSVVLVVLFAVAGALGSCRAHTDTAAAPPGRSVAEVARGFGLDLSRERPKDAAALQAEVPAAAAMREPTGVQDMLTGAASESAGAAQASPDSWSVIYESFSLFTHKPYMFDLILGFVLSIAMALLLTAWPKSLVARDPVEATDERNGAVIVALVGCLAAELVQSSERLSLGAEIALVLFGIGGLIRFRTVFGDPRRTGLMILLTILGLCCGMSQYALAVLAFVIIWLVRYFLLSSVRLLINVRVRRGADAEQVRLVANAAIQAHGAAIVQSQVRKGGRTVQINARARGSISEADLTLALQDALPGARVRVSAS